MLAKGSRERGQKSQQWERVVEAWLQSGKDTNIYAHERRGNPRQSEEAVKKGG